MAPAVLIIDANTSAAQVTSAVIARTLPGATVEAVPSLEDAKLHIQRQSPDMIILDPAPDKRATAQFIQRVKEELPAAYVLVLCSAPTPTLRRQMGALGVDGYLEKPVVLSLFAQELRLILTTPPS